MKIINSKTEDFHMHSLNYSDGVNTVDEIVRFAKEIGLTKIAITDHSQAVSEFYGRPSLSLRTILDRWENVHNDVKVIFGVEADLLNENGDICYSIFGHKRNDFVVLSLHIGVYQDEPETFTQGFINAMRKNKDVINVIGHIDSKIYNPHLDVKKVIEVANELKIPVELNASSFVYEKTDLNNLKLITQLADQVYINSDAHTLSDLKNARNKLYKYLEENNLI